MFTDFSLKRFSMALSSPRAIGLLAVAILCALAFGRGDSVVVVFALGVAVVSKTFHRSIVLTSCGALLGWVLYMSLGSAESADRAANVVYILLPLAWLFRVSRR